MLGLVASLLPTVPALAAPGSGAPDLNEYVTSTGFAPGNPKAGTGMPGRAKTPKPVVWPAAGSAEIDLGLSASAPSSKGLAAPAGAGGGLVKAGSLPVRVGVPASVASAAPADDEKQLRSAVASAPGKVRVEILDRAVAAKAVKSGVALRVVRADAGGSDGRAAVEFDYSGFADAFGANYGSRLQIVQLPACAAVTPDRPECKVQTPVRTVNDPARKTVTADVTVSAGGSGTTLGRSVPMRGVTAASAPVFALAASAAGPAGDFRRTPLQESATWQAGESGGGFSWNYPMRVPQSSGGLNPAVAASYSSASVDGRTMASNGQAGILGEGWDLTAGGFVERRYASCSDDGNQTGDLCWKNDNVTISLGGKTLRAFNDGAQETGWHVENDPGWKVTQCWGTLCGAQPDNGTFNGEYWIITTPDGTRYYFGSNQRLATHGVETESTLAVPVISNNPGEPCYNPAGFAASSCKMGWRWGLDYVRDTRDNSMTYFYEREWEKYGWNLNAGAMAYDRANTLTRIEYGTRAGSENASLAPYVVDFGLSLRCLEPNNPTTCDESKFDQWPDSPFDQVCVYTATSCPGIYSPVFFTIRALANVTMRVRDAAGTGYRDIERFDTPTGFWFPGDGTSPALWLNNIGHVGLAGPTPVTMPNIVFYGLDMDNRYGGTPGMKHWRMVRIVKETGAETLIEYEPASCTSYPNNVDNTGRCFLQLAKPNVNDPVDWTWWYKYVVKHVIERDTAAGGSPDAKTSYEYSTAGASTTDGHPVTLWAFNQSAFQTPYANRTWSDWRGYPTVTVTRDTGTGPKSVVKKLFMRGLDGDRIANDQSTIRHVKMTNSEGKVIDDWSVLRGQLWEEQVLDGTNVASRTIHDWDARQLAGQPLPYAGEIGWAFRIREKLTRTHTRISSGDRVTETTTAFDTDGYPVGVVDKGQVTVTNNGATITDVDTADTVCTSTTYNRNYTAFILGTVSQIETRACPAGTPTGAPLAGSRTYYDGSTGLATAPTDGLATRTDTLTNGSPVTYAPTGKVDYDTLGRPIKTYDALNRASTIGYTPTGAGPVTQTVTTNPAGHATTVVLDPAWAQSTKIIDPNNKTTQVGYDALGRLQKIWKAGRTTAQTPDVAYEYNLSNTAVPFVKTDRLIPNGSTVATYEIFDSRLRPRQAQAPTQDAKIAVVDTAYDTRDQVAVTSTFKAAGTPSGVRLLFDPADVRSKHTFGYDNLSRQITDTLTGLDRNNDQVTTGIVTSTAYTGDSVTVTPPSGGMATTVYSDARGRKNKLRQYKGSTVSTSFLDSTYTYDILGRQTKISDPLGNEWTTGYNILNQVTSKNDPDAGSSSQTYDLSGQVSTATDARGTTLAYAYDNVGRKTGTYKDSTLGTKLASWTYDTLAKGQLTSSTRHEGANNYTTTMSGYDDSYRPMGTSITIPGSAGATLAGTYTMSSAYKVDGSPATVTYPAAGGLPAETVTFGYNSIGQQVTATGLDTYLANAAYFYDGGLYQSVRGASGKQIKATTFREEYTGRLSKAQLDSERAATPGTFDQQYNEVYSYDQAGNVTGINENKTGTVISNQCFGYDGLRRMTQSWTTGASTCQGTPSTGILGGADPYWTTYTYDNAGSRTTELKHAVSGGVATDTTRTYTTPAARAVRPHSLTKIDTKVGAGAATTTDQFTYDAAGNTASHNNTNNTWNELGKLTSAAAAGGTTSTFVYDADGNRILRKDSTGTTVYLGVMELHADTPASAPTATRIYSGGVRTTAGGLVWMVADHHGTSQTSVNASTLGITRRRTDPFGGTRGTAMAWPTQHGFVDGVNDPDTGLIHIGARDYDPKTGRFISIDPVFDAADPQSWHAYAYANNNPTTLSDPTGLAATCEGDDGSPHRCQSGEWGYTPPAANSGGGTGGSGGHGGGGSTSGGRPGDSTNGEDPQGNIDLSKLSFWQQFACGLTYSTEEGCAFRNGQISEMQLLQRRADFWASGWGLFLDDLARGVLSKLGMIVPAEGAAAGAAAGANGVLKATGAQIIARFTGSGRGIISQKLAATFELGEYNLMMASESTTLYRVYSPGIKELGGYWTRTKPVSSERAVRDLALDPDWGNAATQYVEIQVPAGTLFLEGTAARQGAQLPGQGNQILFTSKIDPTWVTGRGSLP